MTYNVFGGKLNLAQFNSIQLFRVIWDEAASPLRYWPVSEKITGVSGRPVGKLVDSVRVTADATPCRKCP